MLTKILLTIFLLEVVLIAGIICFNRRIEVVYKFRLSVIYQIGALAVTGDYEKALAIYSEVPFTTMVWRFWKPLTLESYYPKLIPILKHD